MEAAVNNNTRNEVEMGTAERAHLHDDPTTLAVSSFEACVEHRGQDGQDVDGPCRDCGWLDADHHDGLAVVIEVGVIDVPALRRAS